MPAFRMSGGGLPLAGGRPGAESRGLDGAIAAQLVGAERATAIEFGQQAEHSVTGNGAQADP